MNLSDIPSDHINVLISKSLLNSYCKKYRKDLKKYLNTGNPEALHQLRVYSRRLIAVLDFFSDQLPPKNIKVWKSEIKRFLNSLNQPRDIQVQIDYIEHLAENTNECINISSEIVRFLRKLGTKQEKRVLNSLLKIRKSEFLLEIPEFCKNGNIIAHELLSPSNRKIVGSFCKQKIKPILLKFTRFRNLLYDPLKIAELHQCRICMKNIRYSLEILNPFFSSIRKQLKIAMDLQSILGEIHDCDVWIDFLNGFSDNLTILKIKKAEFSILRKELKYLMTIRQSERETKHRHLLKLLNKYNHDVFEKQILNTF